MSFYRPSPSSSSTFATQNQHLYHQNYFSSSPSQQSQHSFSQSFHSPHIPHSTSLFSEQHNQSIQSRKSDGYEPMNTSPISSSPLQQQYLPCYLTGETGLSTHHHNHNLNLIAPEPSTVPETPNKSRNPVAVASSQSKPAGPPISGIGNLSGIESTAADFETNLVAANNGIYSTPTSSKVSSPPCGVWVTVFGFPASAMTYVVTNFSQYGTILETKANPGSNWLHLKYSNRIEAKKALNRNGSILGGGMMIGVVPYKDEGSEEQDSVANSTNLTSSFSMSRPGSSASRKENHPPSSRIREVKSRIRPLARTNQFAYTASPAVPRESNGLLARAVDFVFGW